MEKLTIVCRNCGSPNVTRDALVRWDVEGQEWTLSCVLDNADCDACEAGTSLEEVAHRDAPYDEPSSEAGDYVTIKRMTVEEAAEQLNVTTFGPTVDALHKLGIIREETLLEQFEREQGSLDGKSGGYARGVKDAISWMEQRNG